ncbi:sulfotransferase [Pseudomaricurvus alcaniphilus]|uniref:sulfotransferase family protein n=1 Tax=Pseudomaricurvus alcaniphilus TaxID=1166482 RepID=UPI001409133F|nr:sulfotransferase [Pseudomaricurvus alcaniphilus]NHN36721.1 sulfotransferase [Pseudomaricurvus alcaniphilus]
MSSKVKKFVRMAGFGSSERYPVSRGEVVSPVFIIGSGRSGNTLLRRILTSTPELYIPPETYVLGALIKSFPAYRNLKWEQICLLVLGSFATSEDFESFPSPYLRKIYLELIALPKDERSLDRILIAFYEFMAKHAKPSAVRWGDKTPMNSDFLDDIDLVFPRAQYVHIVRNGFDVVASYLKMGRYTDPVEAADRWVRATKACHTFAKKNSDRVIEVSYEDLVSSPHGIVPFICKFLGLRYSIDMIDGPVHVSELGDIDSRPHYKNVQKPIGTESINKGRKELGQKLVDRLSPLLAEQMGVFGYE